MAGIRFRDENGEITDVMIIKGDPGYTAYELAVKHGYTGSEEDWCSLHNSQVGEHNVSESAHRDLRLLYEELRNWVQAVLNSQDVDLDTFAEIVEFIKENRETFGNYINKDLIVNDLVTNLSNRVLSASQGVALRLLIEGLNAESVGAIATTQKGAPLGVATLDENGHVPTAQLYSVGVKIVALWETSDFSNYDPAEYIRLDLSEYDGILVSFYDIFVTTGGEVVTSGISSGFIFEKNIYYTIESYHNNDSIWLCWSNSEININGLSRENIGIKPRRIFGVKL